MRHALGIEYDGSAYSGWQRLTARDGAAPEAEAPPTLQAALEAALSRVAAHPVATTCAGRTDAGVHALCQVVHFDSGAARAPRGWMLGTIAALPADISVRWCVPVDAAFDARFSARARRYRYTILNRSARPALDRHRLAWIHETLDVEAMHRAAQCLLGERDFSSFRTVHCQAPHARRDLQRIAVRREGDLVHVDLQANAFLHHMVRNIVGSLLPIGRRQRPESWLQEVLDARDRTQAGPTAPARGLVFVGPLYPKEWQLPQEVSVA